MRQQDHFTFGSKTVNTTTPSIDEGGQHAHHLMQDAKLLSLCDFQPNIVANMLPHPGMAAQALMGAALVLVGSGRQRSEEKRDQ